jgi:hypothetical protein
MSAKPSHTVALLIEKTQMVKDKVREIDTLAGQDDALFRKMVKDYFRTDLKAGVVIRPRYTPISNAEYDQQEDNRRESR